MNYVTLKNFADEVGKDRSQMRKWLLARGFKFIRVRTADSQGQEVIALTLEDADKARETLRAWSLAGSDASDVITTAAIGWFYAIQIVPDLRPERVKLGYADNAERRLADHRTAAPTATLLKKWPCRRVWEYTAIDSITRSGATLLLNEVFEFDDLEALVLRADAFFDLMPK